MAPNLISSLVSSTLARILLSHLICRRKLFLSSVLIMFDHCSWSLLSLSTVDLLDPISFLKVWHL